MLLTTLGKLFERRWCPLLQLLVSAIWRWWTLLNDSTSKQSAMCVTFWRNNLFLGFSSPPLNFVFFISLSLHFFQHFRRFSIVHWKQKKNFTTTAAPFFLEKQERVRKRVFVDSVVAAQQWKRSQKKKERVRMRMTVTVAAAAAEWKEWLLGSPLMLNTPLHVTQTTFCSRPLPNNRWVRFDAFFVSVRYSGWKLQLVWPITAITTIIIISSGLVKRNKKWSYDIWKVKANWHRGFCQKENKKEVFKY